MLVLASHDESRLTDFHAEFEVKVDYKLQEICAGFEVALPEKKLKNKICTLCYGTGSVTQPNGVKVPCPKGCPGYYPPR